MPKKLSTAFPQLFQRKFPKEFTETIEALNARVADLERENKKLRMEWDDFFDKMMHRLERERKRTSKLLEPEPMLDPASDGEMPVQTGSHGEILAKARQKGLIS